MEINNILGFIGEYKDRGLRAGIAGVSNAYRELNTQIDNVSKKGSAAVQSFEQNATQAYKKAEAAARKYKKTVDEITSTSSGTGGNANLTALSKIGIASGIVSGVGISIFGSALSELKNYDEALGHLRYALRATKDEMRGVSNFIQGKASGSFFTSTQVAKTWYELITTIGNEKTAKAALDPTLLMATAIGGRMSLEEVTKLSQPAIQKFNLNMDKFGKDSKGRDYNPLERMYDILMKSSLLTRQHPESFVSLLASSGTSPQMLGISPEEWAAMTGVSMSQGLTEAQAGQGMMALSRKEYMWSKAAMMSTGELGRIRGPGAQSGRMMGALWGSAGEFTKQNQDAKGNWKKPLDIFENIQTQIEKKLGKDVFGSGFSEADADKAVGMSDEEKDIRLTLSGRKGAHNLAKTGGYLHGLFGNDMGVNMFVTMATFKHEITKDTYAVNDFGVMIDKAGNKTLDLNKAIKLYSKGDKLSGTQAVRGLMAEIRESERELKRYADLMHDTFFGAEKKFTTSVTNMKIAFIEKVGPMLADWLTGVSKIFDKLTDVMNANPGVTKTVATSLGVGAVTLGGLSALSLGLWAFGGIKKSLTTLAPGLGNMPMGSFIGKTMGVVGGIATGAPLAAELYNSKDPNKTIATNKANLVMTGMGLGSLFGPKGMAIGAIVGGLVGFTAEINEAANATETLGEFFKDLAKRDVVSTLVAANQVVANKTMDVIDSILSIFIKDYKTKYDILKNPKAVLNGVDDMTQTDLDAIEYANKTRQEMPWWFLAQKEQVSGLSSFYTNEPTEEEKRQLALEDYYGSVYGIGQSGTGYGIGQSGKKDTGYDTALTVAQPEYYTGLSIAAVDNSLVLLDRNNDGRNDKLIKAIYDSKILNLDVSTSATKLEAILVEVVREILSTGTATPIPSNPNGLQ